MQRRSAERDAYLRDACLNDPELYSEVASLLANYPGSASFAPWAAEAAAQLIVDPAVLEPGQRLGPYQIASFMAAGGMGAVYRARDPRMGREVAIKVASLGFSERFSREVHAVAALNHPNICQLYDVGPNYLVMELVEGATLADRIREGPIPAEEALAIGRQIADALEAAHAKGIVHCDLKPGNVKIRLDGTVKVLDFGLAQSANSQAEAGAILGTAAYMSPEQVEGKPVDARSDVFSFGVVLYEMLSCRRAFEGEAILRQDPEALEASADLVRVVTCCLRKLAADRFQSMGEVRRALEQASGKPSEVKPSIAVLPFANMGAHEANEYFSDGLSEEIINALARVPGLKVTARTSAFAFRGKQEDIRKIAAALGVRTVLEGSVRSAGSRIRVTAQLVDAADGSHLWSERFDRELTDVFAVQDEIAAAIARALQTELIGEPVARRHTPNFPAYEAFLKGRHYLFKASPEGMVRARECFKEAITMDPAYADPHVELGNQYLFQALTGQRPFRELAPLVRAQARKALELDSSLGGPHALLGFLASALDYDWSEAERQFRLASQGAAAAAEVCYWCAWGYLPLVGRFREAVEQMDTVIESDPLNVFWRINQASILYRAGMYDRSLRETRKALELGENLWMPHFGLGILCLSKGMFREAVSAFERAYAVAPWNWQVIGHFAGTLALAGAHARSGELVQQLRDAPPHLGPTGMVIYHSICSEGDAAAAWFEKAIEQRDPLVIIYADNPITKPLRESSRWPALAKMMNLPLACEQSAY